MKALYAGSFDPFTKGHLSIALEILANCDQLIIGVGENAGKTPLFAEPQKRLELIKSSFADFRDECRYRAINGKKFTVNELKAAQKLDQDQNCLEIVSYSELTVQFLARKGVNWLFRGERPLGDHEAEMSLAEANNQIANVIRHSVTQCLIPTPRPELNNVSSSGVKRLCQLNQFIVANKYVMPSVHNELMKIYLKPLFEKIADKYTVRRLMLSDNVVAVDTGKIFRELVECYCESKRYYHNLSHISYGYNLLDDFRRIKGFKFDFDKVFLAFAYHDAGKDERASVEKFQTFMSCVPKRNAGLRSEIESLIMSTEHFENKEIASFEQKLISDVDLAILADSENYGLYAQHIFQEYDREDNYQLYAKHRSEVLRKLLKKQLFLTVNFSQLQQEAQINLSREYGYWLGQSE